MDTRARRTLLEEQLTRSIIGAFYTVYNKLGYGILEHVYAAALEIELKRRGHAVAREYTASVYYDGIEIGHHRLDMVVDDRVVIENKARERLHDNFIQQLESYLAATKFQVGLFLHYGRSAKFYRRIFENSLKKFPFDPSDH
ncbi:MAG TPA: GxxExxY protein [Gemmatimonadaceae bacterium]|nr:GxxExxY protein [Gemmatimonadaceae bacterium]